MIPRITKSHRGNGIIEVMVVVVIVAFGVIGAYQILAEGQNLATSTEGRIKAVNIAREGMEIMENIRDTNWVRFSSDYHGCFDTFNNDGNCVGSRESGTSPSRITAGSYVASLASSNWTLTPVTNTAAISGTSRATYLSNFPVYFDANGFTTQTGSTTERCTGTNYRNCLSEFSREIKITRPADDEIGVETYVTWTDTSRPEPYEIRLNTTLKNWKYHAYQKAFGVVTPPPSTPNSCATPSPSFANIGTLTTGTPTSVGQAWTYSATPGNCTYTCTGGYSGTSCATAPALPNSCETPSPSFTYLGTLSTGTPTSVGQAWTYSATPGNCTYDCSSGYSGTNCTTPPVVVVTPPATLWKYSGYLGTASELGLTGYWGNPNTCVLTTRTNNDDPSEVYYGSAPQYYGVIPSSGCSLTCISGDCFMLASF